MRDIDGCFVYKYVSTGGDIVYIGKSENIALRIKQHSSFSGVDEKFEKYKDAKVYVHKCASKHEMDALEVILIEKYKPELNVTSKTGNALSFEFANEISWVDYETIVAPKSSKKKPNTQRGEGDCVISSRVGFVSFLQAVRDWQVLFYFICWLMEQDDADERATISFSIEDQAETSRWVWEYKNEFEKHDSPTNAVAPVLVHCSLSGFSFACTLGSTMANKTVWIDLCATIHDLKQCLPLLVSGLERAKRNIYRYSGLSDGVVKKYGENVYYLFFEIRYRKQFPEVHAPKCSNEEIKKMMCKIHDAKPAHTSPRIEDDFTKEEIEESFWRMLFGEHDATHYMPGGAYWNVWVD